MLKRMSGDELKALSKYDRIAVYLFRHLTEGHTAKSLPARLPFDLETVRLAQRKALADAVIDTEVKNIPDIKYTYDARRNLPAEIEQLGPMTWLQNGKGKYVFQKTLRKNIIDFNALGFNPPLEPVIDQTPKFISMMLGQDEQAVFTRVRNAGLISTFLGFQSMAIQGHHRTTVHYGQVEIDEVQAGIDGVLETIVPISGKGGQDKLSWSQALNLNTYGEQKAPLPGLTVRSLGLWRDAANTVWIVEFTPHTNIDQIEIIKVRRFIFR